MGNILSVDMSNGASLEARLSCIVSPIVGVRFINSSPTFYAGGRVKVFPGVGASFRIESNGEWSAGAWLGSKDIGMSGTISLTGRGLSVGGVSGGGSIELGGTDLSLNAGINDIRKGEWSARTGLGFKDVGMSGTVAVTGRGLSVGGVSGGGSIQLGFTDLSLNAGINNIQKGEWSAGAGLGCKDVGMSGTVAVTGRGRSVGGVSGRGSIDLGGTNLSLNAGFNDIQKGEWSVGGKVVAVGNGMSGTASLTGKGLSVQGVSGKISKESDLVKLSVGAGINFEQGQWNVQGELSKDICWTAGKTADNRATAEEVSGESSTQMNDGNLSGKRKRNIEIKEDQLPRKRKPAKETVGQQGQNQMNDNNFSKNY